jgi:hypothetical protein
MIRKMLGAFLALALMVGITAPLTASSPAGKTGTSQTEISKKKNKKKGKKGKKKGKKGKKKGKKGKKKGA